MVATIVALLCLILVVLGVISFKLGSYLIVRLDVDRDKSEKYSYEPEFLLGAIYCLVTFLVIVPYYHKFYRWGVNFFDTLIFLTTISNLVFVFFPILVYKRRIKRALLVIVSSILIIFVQVFHEDWRYGITDIYLQKYYCGAEEVRGEILGGIIELTGYAGTEAFDGVFENDAHCFSSIGCAEEFYYCDGK